MAEFTSTLSPWDYVVFAAMLVVSMGIGVYFAMAGNRQNSQGEYLMGGRSMPLLPVAISILVSFQSAILMLGAPAEMYTQGTEFFMQSIGQLSGFVIAGLVFVPLLYPLGITSAFEYLDMRFRSRPVRLLATCIFIIGQVIYMGIASYAPSTAFEAVTGIPVWATLITIGVVATFYTTIGGMKAVVWTDVFQAAIMLAGMIAIIIQGTIKASGFSNVWKINQEWDRIRFFNWSPDPRVRHTVWSLTIGATAAWISNGGVSQASVQRYCSLPTLKTAQASMIINGVLTAIVMAITSLNGVILFAYYAGQDCDPLGQDLVDNPNQLIPYMVMEILNYPPIPGLFMASLFSGALSSISSSMNSLAAITWVDILKPHFGERLNEYQNTVVLKCLVLFFGVLALGISFVISFLEGTVIQAAISLRSPSNGALCGLFLLGGLFPFANKYGAFVGGLIGLTMSMWQALGAYVTGVEFRKVSYPNGTCGVNISTSFSELTSDLPTTTTTTMMTTSLTPLVESESSSSQRGGLEEFYHISYMWINLLAILSCIVPGVLVSLATNHLIPEEERKVPEKLQIPLFSRLCCCLPKRWLYFLNGCRTFEETEDTEMSSLSKESSTDKHRENVESGIHNTGYEDDDLPERTLHRKSPIDLDKGDVINLSFKEKDKNSVF